MFFAIAAGLDAVLLMLILKEDQVHEDLKAVCHPDGGDCDDRPKLLRYKISLNFFQIFQSICWTVV